MKRSLIIFSCCASLLLSAFSLKAQSLLPSPGETARYDSYIELPRGYLFGRSYSSSYAEPIMEAGTMVFSVGANDGTGLIAGSGIGSRSGIEVYSLRPGTDGSLSAQHVGVSANPSRSL